MFRHRDTRVEVVRADEVVVEDRTADETRDDAIEETARDHIIVEGRGKVGAAGGIGHDSEKGFEGAGCQRCVEFTANGTLSCPAVDEDSVTRAMPGCDIVERIVIDTAPATDADRIVEGFDAEPLPSVLKQDPDRRPRAGKR